MERDETAGAVSNEAATAVAQQMQSGLYGYMIASWNKVPSRSRWLVLSSENCKLYVYKTEHDPVPIKDVDISRALFLYDAEKNDDGRFCIRSGAESLQLEAGSVQRRNYWLAHLRKERRSYGGKRLYLIQHPEMRTCFSQRLSLMVQPYTGLLSPTTKSSAFQVPESFDTQPEFVCSSSSVVLRQSLDSNFDASVLRRSHGSQKPSTPTRENDVILPNQTLNTFSSLGKRIRHSFREKRRSFRDNSDASRRRSDPIMRDCEECKQLSNQVMVLQEDLKATEDEYEASRQVIDIFQAQVEVLTKEKEALVESHTRILGNGEHEMLGILQEKEVALANLEQQCRKLGMQEEQLEGKVERLQGDTALYKELLQAKDDAIVELTNQLHDCRKNSMSRCSQMTQTEGMGENLHDALEAYACQNKFLNEELLEMNHLLQESAHREDKLLVEASEWEARFYQTQSKYMLLLNELQTPEWNQNSVKFRELIARLMGDSVTGNTPSLRSTNKTYDVYGFQQAASSITSPQNLQESNANQQAAWDGVVTSLKSLDLQNMIGLKTMMRNGIPYHQRGRVWKAVMNCHLRGTRSYSEPEFYKTLFQIASQPHISPAVKQIETDLLRTLPSNRHYEGMNADGIPKLRRVLLAFSIYNPDVGYCQGLNRLVAILLLFLSEEDSFWGLVYIIEKLLPPEYYGQQLAGAQIDQLVLKDLIAEKMPRLASHLTQYSVDISLVTFNWFLCIFVDSLPVEMFLQVWDAFWLEGSKVLFRYALALLKLAETEVLKQTDYVSVLMTLKNCVENLTDIEAVTHVAFQELNPFPMKIIAQKREHHRKLLKGELDKVEAVRREYKRKVNTGSAIPNGGSTNSFTHA